MDLQEALEGIGGWRHAVSCGNRQTWDKDSDGHWIRTPCSCGLDAARAALAAAPPEASRDGRRVVDEDGRVVGTARLVRSPARLERLEPDVDLYRIDPLPVTVPEGGPR